MNLEYSGGMVQREGLIVTDLEVRRGDFLLTVESWHVPTGSLIGLVGQNGAGKTTFINALSSVIKPRKGEISFGTVPLAAMGWRLPELVGRVPDAFVGLEDFTVADHFDLFAAMFEFWDNRYALELLNRLDVPLRKRMKTLSHGTRAKAHLAMVEGSRPRVLLLDEPTSGLDPVVRQELLAVLSEARLSDPGRIVVFSTHILEDVVQVATCVSLVRRGRVFSPAFVDQLQSWRRTDPEARPRMLAAIFGVESFG